TTRLTTLSLHDALPIWSDHPRCQGEICDARVRGPEHGGGWLAGCRSGSRSGRSAESERNTRWRQISRFPRSVRSQYQVLLGRGRSEEHTSELQSRENLV